MEECSVTQEQVKSQLREIIADLVEISDFADHDDFNRDLGIDSMMTIEIIAQIERKMNVVIPESALPEFVDLERTANRIYALVTEQSGTSAAVQA
ncbi:acyl carrier protein [Paenibacillus mucilaginosus 3016]|uniref:Acyl carrier protein n=2 Tax=Paenibacillus mucilaginosus TaxID=61624 RepID=H6NFR0_9BACL|nr:acyl carrier protein [Paenibacillus mucilaginosus]AEI43009.1 acyl carrier protein [Paenibacillus mucilaginosus KNP414]AFC30700.1 acyl carrier protein [Paenibacillus mucilaginosus 3016]WDM24636.1 acyl carrier protein [Paenibacillus mucilaginosus]WFA22650.1 acyl carrier protein [Paenibacillus mucilaginosus]